MAIHEDGFEQPNTAVLLTKYIRQSPEGDFFINSDSNDISEEFLDGLVNIVNTINSILSNLPSTPKPYGSTDFQFVHMMAISHRVFHNITPTLPDLEIVRQDVSLFINALTKGKAELIIDGQCPKEEFGCGFEYDLNGQIISIVVSISPMASLRRIIETLLKGSELINTFADQLKGDNSDKHTDGLDELDFGDEAAQRVVESIPILRRFSPRGERNTKYSQVQIDEITGLLFNLHDFKKNRN